MQKLDKTYEVGDIILCSIPGVTRTPHLCKITGIDPSKAAPYLINNLTTIKMEAYEYNPIGKNHSFCVYRRDIRSVVTQETLSEYIVDLL